MNILLDKSLKCHEVAITSVPMSTPWREHQKSEASGWRQEQGSGQLFYYMLGISRLRDSYSNE